MKIKRFIFCILAMLLLVSLLSCEISSYVAIGLIKSTKDNYCMTSFHRLEGNLALTSRYTKRSEGQIHYTASLEEGEVNVYYYCGSVKELLFNIKAGETLDDRGGYIEKGPQKIIIETVTPSKGKIIIEFE